MSNRAIEYARLAKRFSRLFHTSFEPFFWYELSARTGYVWINLPLLNQALPHFHADYNTCGLSMKEFVRAKYGNDALDLLLKVSQTHYLCTQSFLKQYLTTVGPR